jgi:ATP-dependent helicase/nuclease subunit A
MKSRIEEFMNLNDEQRVALDLSRNIVVEAGAGSGKTRALVARYLKILEEGRAKVDGIVAITFTENAASEMRERIRDMISSYIELYGETKNINREAIKRLPNSPISTIHGFTARILKENPFESLLPPSFEIIEGIERRLFIEEAIDEFIIKLWESQDELVSSVLAEEGYDRKRVRDRLFSIISLSSRVHIDLEHECKVFSKDIDASLDGSRLIDTLIRRVKTDLTDSSNGYVQSRIEAVRANSSYLASRKSKAMKSMLLSEIKNKLDVKGGILGLKGASEIEKVVAASLLELVDSILDLYDSELTTYYLKLASRTYSFVTGKKLNASYLEYEDLLKVCGKSLLDNHSLLRRYRHKFKFIMVDEFQDTDPIQFEIIKLISQNGGANTFIVGDPKQSIFRFRGGDPGVFTSIKKEATKTDKFLRNYRSRQLLIGFYNRFFEKLFHNGYEHMEAALEAKNSERYIEFIFSFDDDASVWRKKEASSVTKRISQLHNYGYDYKDISVLCRSTSNIYLLENELRKHNIPYYSSSGNGFFGRQEIRDVTVFIRYLLSPGDKISEASVLRSLFLGASDGELLAHYTNRKSVESISDYLAFLSELRREALSLTPSAMLEYILERTCYAASLLALPEGLSRYANIKKLINIFRRLEALGHGLVEILEYIDRSVLEDNEPLAQADLEEEDSVKVLTVHKAKGLEFPVVVLMDLNHGTGGRNQTVVARRDSGFLIRYEGSNSRLWETINELESSDNLEEEKRLLYVAKTRAKDLLIISFSGQTKKGGEIKINEFSFAGLFNTVFQIGSNLDDDRLCTLGLKIPIWKANDYTPLIREERMTGGFAVDTIIERFSDVDPTRSATGDAKNEKTVQTLGERTSELEIGTLMHRFLQIWDFKGENIRNTATYVLNESYVVSTSLMNKLIELGEAFLRSELVRRIQRADLIEREVPFYIDIAGKPERRKIDLLIRKSAEISLFDYKFTDPVRLKPDDIEKYRNQLDLYSKAVERMFGISPGGKYLVFLPQVELVSVL